MTPATGHKMLKLFAGLAPPIALLMVGVLLLEPPALTPGQRVPTLRLLTSAGPKVPPPRDIVLEPEANLDPEPTAEPEPEPEPDAADIIIDVEEPPETAQPTDDSGDRSDRVRE